MSWRLAVFMAALLGVAVGGYVDPWVPAVFSTGLTGGFLIGYVQARRDILRRPPSILSPHRLGWRHLWRRERIDVTTFGGER